MASEQDKLLEEVANREYQYGFHSDIEMDALPKGLSEDVVREISKRKKEPEFMLEFRLAAYHNWLKMESPNWAHLKIAQIDFQDMIYYAAPKKKPQLDSLDDVDPELRATFDKLGIFSYQCPEYRSV
jgi:Fe-S cluster assembly protein SufB